MDALDPIPVNPISGNPISGNPIPSAALSTSNRKQRPAMKITFASQMGGGAPPSGLTDASGTTPGLPGTASTGISGVDGRPAIRPGRGWAICGILGGLLGVALFLLSGGLAVSTDDLADNQLVAEAVTDKAVFVWIYQVVAVAAAMLIAVFAAGIFRKLSQQAPAQSLAPMIAVGGLFLVSAMLLVGSGICTEMFFGLMQDTDELDPDTVAAQMAIFNTMGWVWVGAGLAAGAVALTGLRHGTVGRGLAIGSAVATFFIAAVNIAPLQYMALVPAALWMIGAGISFARREQ
jgi:hypothetical protein